MFPDFVSLTLMLFSRLLNHRIKFSFFLRLKSTDINLVDELNTIKTKDLMKIFNEEQTKDFFQLKRSLGGKFQSLQQFQNESKISIDCKHFANEIFISFFSFLFKLINSLVIYQH